MRYTPPLKWSEFPEREIMLYFAHRCEEMLFHYTIDKYKTPILNTYQLVNEYCETAHQIEMKIISAGHDEQIYEEFSTSLKSDVVINECWGKDRVALFLSQWGSMSSVDRTKHMKYLQSILGNGTYFEWTKETLLKYIKKPREKAIIERIAKTIVPEIMSIGYSHGQIYHSLKDCFFSGTVDSIDVMKKFLSCFDGKKRRFNVYIAISKEVYDMVQVLEKRLAVKVQDDGNFKKFKIKEKNRMILMCEDIESVDPYSAATRGHKRIDLFMQFYGFYSNKRKPFVQNRTMVMDIDADRMCFVEAEGGTFNIICEMNKREAIISSEENITLLFKNGFKEIPVLMRALELHNAAISVSERRNAYTNLWSILEVLIQVDKNGGKNKIDAISDAICNILSESYFRDIIIDMKQSIIDCIGDEWATIACKITDFEDEDEKLAAILFLDSTKELRTELISKLGNYPVLRNRIHLYSEECKVSKNMIQKTDKYACRVKWHLHRLYRTRNLIVHSGIVPKRLKPFGEHLHYYVDKLIMALIFEMNKNNVNTVENALTNLTFNLQTYRKHVDPDAKIDIKALNLARR